jgi:hypothetical protein
VIAHCSRWHRSHGRPSKEEQWAKQQYLTPQEENALVKYVLHMARIGDPLPVQSLRYIAMVIARQRNSVFQIPGTDSTVRPPGKNWSQGLRKRHKELKAKRTKAIDWNRYDPNIYDKVAAWFTAIGEELRRPDILLENVYNMDEIGIMLSVFKFMKVLVGWEELRNY